MKEYCSQNNGDCSNCSLVSYNLDCVGNPVKLEQEEKGMKIARQLEKSSFGSGEMIAGILMDPEFQMPCENGVWEIIDAGDGIISYHRRDFMRNPSWQTQEAFSVGISDDTIEILLGCGEHSASCVFNKASGDLLKVVPDDLPSNRFWGDGDHPDLSLRAMREFLRMHGMHAPVTKLRYWD